MIYRKQRLNQFFIMLLVVSLQLSFWSVAVAAQDANVNVPQIVSETAVLINADTGQVLFDKDKDRRMYPASITKIMTALLALKYGKPSDKIMMSDDAVFSIDRDSSHIALDVGETLTLEEALYALGTESANDAANGIAELIGGNLDNFTKLMNEQVEMLGLKNTNFVNAHGLQDNSHYTSAYDMAMITSEALKIPGLTTYFSTKRHQMAPTNIQPEIRYFNNRNSFLNGVMPYDTILMSKTGWTSEAEHTLVTVAKRGGTTLIAVVMKSSESKQKYKDTTALLDYGFNAFYGVRVEDLPLQSALNEFTLDKGELSGAKLRLMDKRPVVLVPIGIESENIKAAIKRSDINMSGSLSDIYACLQVKGTDETQTVELLDVPVKLDMTMPTLDSKRADSEAITEEKVFKDKIFIRILFIIIPVFIFLVPLKRYYYRRKERRRRLRRQQRIKKYSR
ncbi:D-alanyl-D-alanine carboxypeptidase family protein [Anaerotignum sp.]|uniref:D-alanyl-D-alanine carboxypeptidase family protein n=1 Tax=Anaerotignum sp. TaxID=2039241 RepID=UPI00289681B0|nr:D-alanyl-D-alanine carboxypeptidase family protein [Anaerotignum sp.]